MDVESILSLKVWINLLKFEPFITFTPRHLNMLMIMYNQSPMVYEVNSLMDSNNKKTTASHDNQRIHLEPYTLCWTPFIPTCMSSH
jgi:hypothetical protein